jgi:precorrin-6B C5,15-methyltransferase / cobalt-precorrin-6B C5,C15-methyltransferase
VSARALIKGRPAAPGQPAGAAATIAVIGVAGDDLAPGGAECLAAAELVAGGGRQLAAHAPPRVERVLLDGDLEPGLARIGAARGPVAVLASGDPGFFGIARRLARRFGPQRLEILPAPSSVALAFARAGLPWDDALVVSAHGRAPDAAVAAARAHPKVAVLTEPRFTPADLAGALSAGPQRWMVVAERLGEPAERLTEGTPAQIAGMRFADPNVALVLDPSRADAPKRSAWPPRTPVDWALGEESFDHREGMITKAEVRALALARLGPGVGDLIWDVGAGSGSVAVECVRLGSAAIAVDRDPDACRRARANAAAHGVDLQVVEGEAPGALEGLPDPDGVFVGGGGNELPALVDLAVARARRAVVVALATVERVTTATERLEAGGLEVDAVMLQASRLRRLGAGHRLAAGNPVFVAWGRRR